MTKDEQIKQLKQQLATATESNVQLQTKVNQQAIDSDIDSYFYGKGVDGGIIESVKLLATVRVETDDTGKRIYEDKDGIRQPTIGDWIKSVGQKDFKFTKATDAKEVQKAPANLKRSQMSIDEKLEYQSIHGQDSLLALPA